MVLTKTPITLSSTYYTYAGVDGYLEPNESYPTLWSVGNGTTDVIIDPGQTIKCQSVETSTSTTRALFVPHIDISSIGCIVQQCSDTDSTYYHFTITNIGMQSVKLTFGDNVAYIVK